MEGWIAIGLVGAMLLWGLYDKITKGSSGLSVESDDDESSLLEDMFDLLPGPDDD